MWFWGSDQAQEWTPLWPVLCCHQTQRQVSCLLISVGIYRSTWHRARLLLPFSLAAWFMGDPFPLHQLLHCIGVDYRSNWVAFVSPRVFLFHCLFPPETWGRKSNLIKQINSLFIQVQHLQGRSTAPLQAHCVPVSQLWLGATQHAAWKGTTLF